MKTSELTGAALDWAVAKCEGLAVSVRASLWRNAICPHNYSTDWSLSGPIIEREEIKLTPPISGESEWFAVCGNGDVAGPTPLIAAMRCYVASKLGDEVEIPSNFS